MDANKAIDSIIISKSGSLMVIGRKLPSQAVKVINAFEGEEAELLYKKLVGKNGAV